MGMAHMSKTSQKFPVEQTYEDRMVECEEVNKEDLSELNELRFGGQSLLINPGSDPGNSEINEEENFNCVLNDTENEKARAGESEENEME